jgi:hypothetical protein
MKEIGSSFAYNLPVVLFVATLLLLLNPALGAAASFTWNAPWSVTFTPACNLADYPMDPMPFCVEYGQKGFGSTSSPTWMGDHIVPGSLESLRGVAVINNFSRIRGTAIGATVEFSRPFTLSGGGTWDVDVNGILQGSMSYMGGHPEYLHNGGFNLALSAGIGDLTVLSFTDEIHIPGTTVTYTDAAFHQPINLIDGQYALTGRLSGHGITTWALGEGGGLFASWDVGLNATPLVSGDLTAVPEPATLSLMALTIPLIWARRLKKPMLEIERL